MDDVAPSVVVAVDRRPSLHRDDRERLEPTTHTAAEGAASD
jgi:hypothetical protein